MIYEFFIGSVVWLILMVIHLIGTVTILHAVRNASNALIERKPLFILLSLFINYIVLAVILIMSVAIWACAYYFYGFTNSVSESFYAAFANYTTLGYGRMQEEESFRIFSPLTAASGILMFAWSASLLVFVLQEYLPKAINRK